MHTHTHTHTHTVRVDKMSIDGCVDMSSKNTSPHVDCYSYRLNYY